MSYMEHTIEITHRRRDLAPEMDAFDIDSRVEIEAHSTNLVSTWSEALSRMPSDVYAALKEAMGR
jgi:hypothetical protein